MNKKYKEGYVKGYEDAVKTDIMYRETYPTKGLVKEETKPNVIEEAKTYWDSIKDAWICPEGYIFKDENGNVINATKIVLEKKKKEYPKTYEECCKVFGLNHYLGISWNSYDVYSGAIDNLSEQIEDIAKKLEVLSKLLLCRAAYWKIAGEEMGLGKPWKPTMETVYCISRNDNVMKCSYRGGKSNILEFPTPEMRDAFKENFDPDIEFCKELL